MSAPFRPPNLALTAVGLSLATFMQVLDTTIANVSLPTIAGNLGVSINQSTWVITSFAVSNAIALPLTGYLSRRFGEVKLFVWATLLFSVASFLCGTAQSMGMLILFRTIQGAVAGPMYPITQTLLVSIYPAHKRGQAMALLAMVTVVAPIAGPILGGWITDSYSWPWIFFINVPIGIFASVVIATQMAGKREVTERPRMDYVGLAALIVGVGALQVMLDKGNDLDWFNSSFIVVACIVAALALCVFVIWELTDRDPIVNLRLFRHRNFCAGTAALVLGFAAFFSVSLLVPLWLQRNLGYTATWAGLATAPLGILPVLLAPLMGKYASRMDLRLLATGAFLVMGATCFMRSYFYLDVDFFHIAGVQLLMGLGVALFFMPVLTILMSDLPVNDIASGSGLATFMRTLGGSFAASLSIFLWDRRAGVHHASLTEHVTAFDPATRDVVGALGRVHAHGPLAMLNQMITRQSYQLSFNDVFHLLGWLFLAVIVVIWLVRPPFAPKAGTPIGGH